MKRLNQRAAPSALRLCVSLLTATFAAAACGQTVINVPPSPSPASAGAGVTVNVFPGGSLANSFDAKSGSTVNIAGGSAGSASFESGSTFNLSSGSIDNLGVFGSAIGNFYGGEVTNYAGDGSLNIFGGNFPNLHSQGPTHIYGGTFDDDLLRIRINGKLFLHASELWFNGVPVAAMPNVGDTNSVPLGHADVLSGVFTNGTPFIFSGDRGEINSPIQLIRTADHSPGPPVINVPNDPPPAGVFSGQTLNLATGGALPANFSAVGGSTVNILGGAVGDNFKIQGATAHITGGALGTMEVFSGGVLNLGSDAQYDGLDTYRGAIANISGGLYTGLNFFRAFPGSTLNVSGGDLRGAFAADNAHVNFSGGVISVYRQESSATNGAVVTQTGGDMQDLQLFDGAQLASSGGVIHNLEASTNTHALIDGARVARIQADTGSDMQLQSGSFSEIDNLGGSVKIRGGALGDSFELNAPTEIYGYDFQVDGAPISGLSNLGDSTFFNYTAGTTFSGSLADGTPFIMSPSDREHLLITGIDAVKLIRTVAPTRPATVTVPADAAPFGASAGQSVILQSPGQLYDNFTAGPQSYVETHGGTIGNNFEASKSDVLFAGGAIGAGLDVFDGAHVTVSGASVGRQWEVHSGGTLTLSAGLLDYEGRVLGGQLNISGGVMNGVDASNHSALTVSGGTVNGDINLRGGSTAVVTGGLAGFNVSESSVVDIKGGRHGLQLLNTAEGKLSGGIIDHLFVASGASAQVRGGAFGDGISVNSGANVVFYGSDFRIDGQLVPNLAHDGQEAAVTIAAGQLFTGTLADGTPFAFTSAEADNLPGATLHYAAPPSGPAIINVPTDVAPLGVHEGQQLNLADGGALADHFSAGRGSIVNITGGMVGQDFEAYQAVVNVSGGQIANAFDAFLGTKLNVSGGTIGASLRVYAGSTVDVSGGQVSGIEALSGSIIDINGGHIGSLHGAANSKTTLSGGFTSGIRTDSSSMLDIFGVDFKLNGLPIAGLTAEGNSVTFVMPTTGGALTATLADGSPLLISSQYQPPYSLGGMVRLIRSTAPPTPSPSLIQISAGQGPFGLGAGQTLELTGGQLPANFVAGSGSTLRIDGGSVGSGFGAFDADINITGGAFSNLTLFAGAQLHIHGGTVPRPSAIMSGAFVEIFGKQFLLDGQPISGLKNVGDIRNLTERSNQRFTAVLADGSTLEWFLNPLPSNTFPAFGISRGAGIALHLVPEPSALYLGSFASWVVGALVKMRRRSVWNRAAD
jgi:hypothetical protein